MNDARKKPGNEVSVPVPSNPASICYTPWGAVGHLRNSCVGTGCTQVEESYYYNKRLQPAVIELGTTPSHAADTCRVYNYYAGHANAAACSETPSNWPSGSNNNGNVAGYYYKDNVNSTLNHSATYTYDSVNRLAAAAATGTVAYSQTFTIDAYGNLKCTPNGPGCRAPTFSSSTNRITSSGYSYDAAGDVTGDGTYTYIWDAEGRLSTASGPGGGVGYWFNALGQRVEGATDEAYGADGSLLWRYTGYSTDPNQRAFVPFAGSILAEYYGGSPGGTIFDHNDQIGSLSAASDYSGENFQERLYYPFGEFWTGADPDSLGEHQTFAELPDYDSETDLYNTLNRHYSPTGRWMSPDPGGAGADPSDPQTWNMYAYVRNNPTKLTDPSGLHQECDPDTSFTDNEGVLHIVGGKCREVPDDGFFHRFWTWLLGGTAATVRISPKTLRNLWGRWSGQDVPKDANGNYYQMHHIKAKAEGGAPRDPANLKPMERSEHIAYHRDNGDAARWGARAQAKAQARAEEQCGCQVSETDAGEFINAQTGAAIPVPPDPVVSPPEGGAAPGEEMPPVVEEVPPIVPE